MKNKKILKILLFIFVVAILIFGAWYYFVFNQSSQVSQQIPVLASYYNQDYKYSLAIPPDWSGFYSVEEIKKGNTAFVYTGDPKTKVPIFILYVMPTSMWNSQKNSPNSYIYIAENGGNTYLYNLVSADITKNLGQQYKDQFLKMTSEVGDIVKTIKFN